MTLRVNSPGQRDTRPTVRALPATIEDDEKCMNYERDESRNKSKLNV